MNIPTLMLSGLIGVLSDRPVKLSRALRKAGVELRGLHAADGAMELELSDEALHAALDVLDMPDLGLVVGSRAPIRSLGVLGDVLTHAPTLRIAIDDLVKYSPLTSRGSRFRLREGPSYAALGYEPPSLDPRSARLCVEVTFALALRIARLIQPEAQLSAVHLRGAPGACMHAMQALFGCTPVFGADSDELSFPSALLDAPQCFSDPSLYMLYSRHAAHVLRSERKREPLHEQVKRVLRHEVDLGFVRPDAVARRVGLSPRSFRRRLSIEGHSLSELADQVRREIALDAVGESDTPIKLIAERTGFGEVSSFHRAFKRWTGGVTPARYRVEAQASLDD